MHCCSFCAKSFPSPSKLRRHHLVHTGQRPFRCGDCDKAFNQPAHLKSHSQKFHQRPSTEGGKDGVSFPGLQLLSSNHREPTHETFRRDDGAGDAASFSSPQIKQKGEMLPQNVWLSAPGYRGGGSDDNPKVVDGFMFQNRIEPGGSWFKEPKAQDRFGFAVDKPSCSAKRGFTCKICFQSFGSSLQLQIHLPVHKTLKQIDVGARANSKTSPQPRKLSLRGSGSTKSHQCPVCPKIFSSPSKLQRHFLIHTGQKPFPCLKCGKAFRQETHLKSHLQATHKMPLSREYLESKGLVRRREEERIPSLSNASLTSVSDVQGSNRQLTQANSSVELELQCKISLSALRDLSKSETKSGTVANSTRATVNHRGQHRKGICPHTQNESVEGGRCCPTRNVSKPFHCAFCSRSFRLELNLIRHQDVHNKQASESNSPADNQCKANANTLHSKELTSPEPYPTDDLDLNIIVKSEPWSEGNGDQMDLLLRHGGSAPLVPQSVNTPQNACRSESTKSTFHQCQACSKSFLYSSKLQRHMMTHSGQRPFKCQVCGKSFRQKTHLRVHCRTHQWSRYHKQRSHYLCRPPSRTAGCNLKRLPPVQTEDSERRAAVRVVSELQRGQDTSLPGDHDNGEPTYLRCAAKAKQVVHSVQKGRNHSRARDAGRTPHRCMLCFKCFSSPSKLRRHEMVHTGLKPFQCLVCGRTFRQVPHLKVHERTHSKWRPPVAIHQQGEIVKKWIESHEGNPRERPETLYASTLDFMDGGIKKNDADWLALSAMGFLGEDAQGTQRGSCSDAHISSAFPFELSSEIPKAVQNEEGADPSTSQQMAVGTHRGAGTLFQSSSVGEKALQDHSGPTCRPQTDWARYNWCEPLNIYECDGCGGSFEKERDLLCHQCNSGGQPKTARTALKYHCDICLKRFVAPSKLARHYRVHTGQRPFGCDVCGKTFTQLTHLRSHQKAHM